MSWPKKNELKDAIAAIVDVRQVTPFNSFCRKCSCHHPLDSNIRGFLKGCICNPTGRRGSCGRYVPTDNLEYLEYLAVLKEEKL